MARTPLLERRMTDLIFNGKKDQGVFMHEDFEQLGASYSQVGRILRKLVDEGRLVRFGTGLYARTVLSEISGKPVIDTPVQWLAKEFLERRGVTVKPTEYGRRQKAGKSQQVPTGNVIGVDRRVTRQIRYRSGEISYALVP